MNADHADGNRIPASGDPRAAPEREADGGAARDIEEKRDANALMMTGAGIGLLGAVTAVIGGAVCPVCVVAAPALLGLGAFRRWRAARPRPPASQTG